MDNKLLHFSAMWKCKDKNGKLYLKGSFNNYFDIMAFSNKFKERDDNKPDYILYLIPKGINKPDDKKSKTYKEDDDMSLDLE